MGKPWQELDFISNIQTDIQQCASLITWKRLRCFWFSKFYLILQN